MRSVNFDQKSGRLKREKKRKENWKWEGGSLPFIDIWGSSAGYDCCRSLHLPEIGIEAIREDISLGGTIPEFVSLRASE